MNVKVKKQMIDKPEKTAEILEKILKCEDENDQMKEHFWAIGLNSRLVIQYIELVSLGTLEASLVHPRELFRLAIQKMIAKIIVVHNHPSGDVEPSEADIEITHRLVKAGEILGIQVLDHIIIGKNFYSFKENNLIK